MLGVDPGKSKQNTCQHVLDVDERGDVLCNAPATNVCGECHMRYCDEHFNELMGLCDVDSEVEGAKHI